MSARMMAVLSGPPSNALALPSADLPALYVRARDTLRQCVEIDEAKDIHDKHAAIGVYAEQARDKTLLEYAKRVQLRAFERIGELLAEIEGEQERKDVAKRYGIAAVIGRRAYETSLIPRRVRDKLIEASPPPSRMKLATHAEGYVPNRHREGFGRYVRQREENVKIPATKQAENVFLTTRSFLSDLSDAQSDGVGGRYGMDQLGRATLSGDVGRYTHVVERAIEALRTFLRSFPLAQDDGV